MTTRLNVLAIAAALLLVGSHRIFAFTPGTDHNLMNATSGVVVLDIHSLRDKDITHYGLAPGYSVGFNGVFLRLRVRLHTGKIFSFTAEQLRQAHGGTMPSRGQWLVEDSGVRSVSSRGYHARISEVSQAMALTRRCS
jgi:hypothetical protein